MMRSGELDPAESLTQREMHSSAIDAYKAFDENRPGWIKVKIEPAVSHRTRRDTMVREILRNEVQRLVADAEAQLAEVLPAREYEEEHLPGAIHLPLTKLTRETAAKLRRDRPVIVYCYDAR